VIPVHQSPSDVYILPAIAGSWPPPVDRYASDIARVSEQLTGGSLSLPIDPANIEWMRAHMRGEYEDPLYTALSRGRP